MSEFEVVKEQPQAQLEIEERARDEVELQIRFRSNPLKVQGNRDWSSGLLGCFENPMNCE